MDRLLSPKEIVRDGDKVLCNSPIEIKWENPELSQVGYPAHFCHAVKRKINKPIAKSIKLSERINQNE